jgi:hypothetical protein
VEAKRLEANKEAREGVQKQIEETNLLGKESKEERKRARVEANRAKEMQPDRLEGGGVEAAEGPRSGPAIKDWPVGYAESQARLPTCRMRRRPK